MFIQLGYVVLFSSAFPMAAFCAFINNLIEIRSDAFKMCFIYQRPFGERVSNIGMWLVMRRWLDYNNQDRIISWKYTIFLWFQNTMEVMGLIAILVNCALIGLSGQVHRMFPDISKTQTILLIVALEVCSTRLKWFRDFISIWFNGWPLQHVMLLIRFLISCLIPDKPQWVATEMAKVEFARREAVNRISSATTTPPSSGTAVTIAAGNDRNFGIQENIFVEELNAECMAERISRRWRQFIFIFEFFSRELIFCFWLIYIFASKLRIKIKKILQPTWFERKYLRRNWV